MSYSSAFKEYLEIARENSLSTEEKIDKVRDKFVTEEPQFKLRNQRKLNKRLKKELNIDDPSIDLFIKLEWWENNFILRANYMIH